MKTKTILSVAWLIFTFTLVTWWWIFAFNPIDHADIALLQSRQRMLAWEGFTLLLLIVTGGVFLIFLSYKDQKRHDQLKLFLATFSHDIKTSISRLRLQTDILFEDEALKSNSVLKSLLTDISSLDLQLENSLFLTHLNESKLLNENIKLASLVQSLAYEYPELIINLSGSATVFADKRALKSILKNLIENSCRHGKATKVEFQIRDITDSKSLRSSENIQLIVEDDGDGSVIDPKVLGEKILKSSDLHGSGVGLYLVKQLVQRLKGKIEFQNNEHGGFQTIIMLRGSSR